MKAATWFSVGAVAGGLFAFYLAPYVIDVLFNKRSTDVPAETATTKTTDVTYL